MYIDGVKGDPDGVDKMCWYIAIGGKLLHTPWVTGAEDDIGMAEEDEEAEGLLLLLLPPSSSETSSCNTVDEL